MIITIVLVLVVIGVILYLLETYFPMDPGIRLLIRMVVLVAVVLWLFQLFGVFHGSLRIP